MYGKPAASLSSGLLARKGHARPAMRPQGYVSLTPAQPAADDLGWNDMGEDTAAQPAAAAPEPAPVEPVVLRQRAELDERFAPPVALDAPEAVMPVFVAPEIGAPEAPVPEAAPPAPVSSSELARVAHEINAGKSKSAFTLRLDTDRHLRLRLASAVRHQSAQQLVTEALDAFLQTLTDVDALARQIAAREGRD
ncbi:MAG: hypothetical protein WDN24_12975 [Sphingomonas sp.]